jgi:Fe-S-cluster-containing dehydrogenase component/DMSO reductase anchor subunit
MGANAAALRLPLVEQLLAEQRETAVERFARQHARGELPVAARYRALLPQAQPRAGEQYAFEVDLDACTGCKACVTGCHSLNGLDDGEVWRSVGLLHGGSVAAPAQRTITSSCHHCVEPACLSGCPVKAYEKDPVTGIVKHLDDQCIGCQYCVFMCPYDAPKFNVERGIVRKCDMCSDRLRHGDAPACVQACPNEAIRITVVDQVHVAEAAQAGAFLPGAPAPEHTLPTTLYRTREELPRNLLPADFYTLAPEAAHPPLAVMLVVTQLSVGVLAGGLVRALAGAPLATLPVWTALVLCLVGLTASALHLGRPWLAFRALLGVGTSWLSREIVAFALFFALTAASALSGTLPLVGLATASGLAAVFCSVMVYGATRRPFWSAPRTGARFFGTTALLGAAGSFALAACAGRLDPVAAAALAVASLAKLVGEVVALGHLRDRRHTALKRSALLLVGPLARPTIARFACGVAGLVVPLGALALAPAAAARAALGIAALACALAGELLERHLFFVAAAAPRMPGGPS